jgi:hypothetical protein
MRSEAEARTLILRQIGRCRPDLERVEVAFHGNSSTMVSRTVRADRAALRLHRIFSEAPEDLLWAIVRCFFARLHGATTRAYRARLKDYVALRRQEILRPVPPTRTLPPAGRVFDLEEIRSRVSGRYFPGMDPVQIAWSRKVLRRLMGKWIETPPPFPNLVLINRLLDAPQVPHYYLEFLVFHELLHEAIPAHRSSGRWVHHPPEFRARERQFPEYERARDWERKNVVRLYRRASSGNGSPRRPGAILLGGSALERHD